MVTPTHIANEGVRYRLLELRSFDQPQNADTQIAFGYERLGNAYAEMSAGLSETLDETGAPVVVIGQGVEEYVFTPLAIR